MSYAYPVLLHKTYLWKKAKRSYLCSPYFPQATAERGYNFNKTAKVESRGVECIKVQHRITKEYNDEQKKTGILNWYNCCILNVRVWRRGSSCKGSRDQRSDIQTHTHNGVKESKLQLFVSHTVCSWCSSNMHIQHMQSRHHHCRWHSATPRLSSSYTCNSQQPQNMKLD